MLVFPQELNVPSIVYLTIIAVMAAEIMVNFYSEKRDHNSEIISNQRNARRFYLRHEFGYDATSFLSILVLTGLQLSHL
jgi:hypothetical protein